MKTVKIAYIGGGSRGWALGLMSDLAMEESLCGTVKLYDIDKDAAKSNEIIGNRLSSRDDVCSKWKYETSDTLQEVLEDVDFVIISILPGTFDEMESDVHAPEKYGVYQSVGDTVGPGGLMRALRVIPMYVEIAEAIKKYAKDAWVINYTNPMTICMKTLYKVFPEIKAFGCCHEVFGTQKLLASALEDILGIKDVQREEIKINVLGINHFTWIDKASYKDIDLMNVYKQFADKYAETGYEREDRKGHWINSSFTSTQRVKLDLFKRYGLIAAAGDRHLAEFVPNSWYLKDKDTTTKWKFSVTTVKWRKEDLKNRLEKSRKLADGEIEFEIKKTGEDGVKQMKALLGIEDLVTNVNIPNVGQMQDVPLGAVVETNALFRKDSILPVISGKLPAEINAMVSKHVFNVESIVDATLNNDLELVFKTFCNEPMLSSLSLDELRELFNEMIYNTKKYVKCT